MEFVIAAVLLVLLALAILSVPWWRRSADSPPPLSGEQLARELGDDVATGMLAADDLKPAARDLEATAERDAGVQGQPRRRWGWSLAALLLVPIAAGALYWHFGDWRAAVLGESAATRHAAETALARLRTHLTKHPSDLQGWIDLGQGYELLGRYSDAATAFGRASGLEPKPDPDVLALWGEAQLLADPQHVTAEERQIFAQVLELDPNNTRGLWYAGLIALSRGDRAAALGYWRRLLAEPDLPPQVAELIRSRLPAAGSAPAADAGAGRLEVTVKLSPSLASRVESGETLYVFVRNPAGGAPFAVRRLTVDRLPVTVVLSDDDAMVNGHDLSSATGALEVVAWLAPDGGAEPQPGDLVGTYRLAPGGATGGVTVTIDRRIPASGTGTPAAGTSGKAPARD